MTERIVEMTPAEVGGHADAIVTEVEKVIVGKRPVIELVLDDLENL